MKPDPHSDLFADAPILKGAKGSAKFSRDGTIRREIRRWWTPEPKRWVAWLMTNPSDASADRNDPTALRVTAFSRSWGYDGWIGVNLIPFVSSTMPSMWKWFDWENNGALADRGVWRSRPGALSRMGGKCA